MTKSELIETISTRIDVPKKRAEDVVNAVFESMKEALLEEERIEIRGFGSFSIREHRAKRGRNPRTGDTVDVDEKRTVHFKAGKELRDRVDG
jgi:integration host factor subunit beta